MGISAAIGNTPHIVLAKLSAALGRTIVGKAEFLNPGGSVKDRAARGIIDDAEKRGVLAPGGTIVEGTAGNTGIALALIANERGYRTTSESAANSLSSAREICSDAPTEALADRSVSEHVLHENKLYEMINLRS